MGFSPAEVDAMSLWQFRAVAGGVAQANGVEDKTLTREDFDRLGDLIDNYTLH